MNRAALPLAAISRMMAAYSVASGLLPPGLVHRPFAPIAAIISLARIGTSLAASTCAALRTLRASPI
ncbi:MAG: hypothetical protein ACK5RX_11370 [bacterium]